MEQGGMLSSLHCQSRGEYGNVSLKETACAYPSVWQSILELKSMADARASTKRQLTAFAAKQQRALIKESLTVFALHLLGNWRAEKNCFLTQCVKLTKTPLKYKLFLISHPQNIVCIHCAVHATIWFAAVKVKCTTYGNDRCHGPCKNPGGVNAHALVCCGKRWIFSNSEIP